MSCQLVKVYVHISKTKKTLQVLIYLRAVFVYFGIVVQPILSVKPCRVNTETKKDK